MKILVVAAEATPFLRTGDVATVVTGLCVELRRQHDVRLIMPRYRSIANIPSAVVVRDDLRVSLGAYPRIARIIASPGDGPDTGAPTYFVDNEYYFGRDNPYGYLDDYERFIFFARTIMTLLHDGGLPEMPGAVKRDPWMPDVIHGHDWTSGLLPMWLHNDQLIEAIGHRVPFVYTLHNAGFQGEFGFRALQVADLENTGVFTDIGETPRRINFMARGIVAADVVNTVSKRHAAEIESGAFAAGLQQAIRVSNRRIEYVLNGLDYGIYDPSFDSFIAQNYGRFNLERRYNNKEALQRRCGFQINPATPIIGIVSRLLIAEKGFGLLTGCLESLVADGAQIVIVGMVGDYQYQEAFLAAQEKHPQQLRVFLSADDTVSRPVFAGADIILVPSYTEPCGSQQMIAMHYGAIPVVRETGGLADTVAVANPDARLWPKDMGVGYVFQDYSAAALLDATRQALACYRDDPAHWVAMQRHNMRIEFSWELAATEYLGLYAKAIAAATQPGKSVTQAPIRRAPLPEPSQPAERDELLAQAIVESAELAMSTELEEYLKQVARLARGLFRSDAVLIWISRDDDRQRVYLEEYSIPDDDRAPQRRNELDLYRRRTSVYLDQSTRTWQHIFYHGEASAAGQLQTGFLESELARTQGWSVQITAPMNTHGRTLGWIDAYFTRADAIDSRFVDELVTFAKAIALDLEKKRLRRRDDRLLEASRALAHTQTLDETIQVALKWTHAMTYGEIAHMYLADPDGVLRYRQTYPQQDSPPPVINIPDASITATSNVPSAILTDPGRTWIACILRSGPQLVGCIEVVHQSRRIFAQEDEQVLLRLSMQVAEAIQSASARQRQLDGFQRNLETLAGALVGSSDLSELMDNTVRKTAEVLRVDAATLYLVDEQTRRVVIQAASGYQTPLVEAGAYYEWGEGVTGRIAEQNQAFGANSLNDLRAQGGSPRGKYDHLQGEKRPAAFYGLPLNIAGRNEPIGVLKVESLQPRPFTDEDVLLIRMMGNVIAAVVYNAQLSDRRLRKLNVDLGRLSDALAGSADKRTLMQRIVDTIAGALRVDAATLYLVDEQTRRIVIQAASGYQTPLVDAGAYYEWGEGVTGRIVQKNEAIGANSLNDLRAQVGSPRGKYDHLQGEKRPAAFFGLPLNVVGRNEPIGVLKVESLQPRPFTGEDVLLIQMMGNVIAAVVNNAELSEARLRSFSADLAQLSGALADSADKRTLMNSIVSTITKVLHVDAATLYLVDEQTRRIVIQAASGYQTPLVDAGAYYEWGEGVTGRIVQKNEAIGANSLNDLRAQVGSPRGKYDHLQGEKRPAAFFGLPLNVAGRNEPIGVLKVESLEPRPFTGEDVLLIRMMGNVIAAVVQNAERSEARLRWLSDDLTRLSLVLASGHDAQTLMENIVHTITEVLRVDAATLYLVDEQSHRIVIQAASGYQTPLVAVRAYYEWGEGVTGRIAEQKKAFGANSLNDLRAQGGSPRGKYDHLQGEKRPAAFYGLPLNVAGRNEPIGVLKVESLQPRPFTSEDVLLIEMMGNVIAAVVYNAQIDRQRLRGILSHLGTLSAPQPVDAKTLLDTFVCANDADIVRQLAAVIGSTLGNDPAYALREAQALYAAGAIDMLAEIANWAEHGPTRTRFNRFHQAALSTRLAPERIDKVFTLLDRFTHIEELAAQHQDATPQIEQLIAEFARESQATVKESRWQNDRYDATIDVSRAFATTYLPAEMPLVAYKRGFPNVNDLTELFQFLRGGKQVLLPVWGAPEDLHYAKELIEDTLRQQLDVDVVLLDLENIQTIVGSTRPDIELRHFVLSQVRLTNIQPYTIFGPVKENIFFGREREINLIRDGLLQGHSYTLIGARRIGKTSVLQQLHDHHLPRKNVRSLYHICSTLSSYDQFMDAAIMRASWRPAAPPSAPATFRELFAAPPDDMPLVILLDEADKLIPSDQANDWKLFDTFRSLDHSNRARFVFCGERTLLAAFRFADANGPQYNFAEQVLLGPLQHKAVKALVTQPMQRLDIELADANTIVNQIYDVTGGHPNVVQRLCKRLIERLNEREVRRITLDDVTAVEMDPEFQKVDFLETYWEQATRLERIITLIMVQAGKTAYAFEHILGALDAHNLTVEADLVQQVLQRLVSLRSILNHDRRGYSFRLKAFPDLLAQTTTLDELLLVYKHGDPAYLDKEITRSPSDANRS